MNVRISRSRGTAYCNYCEETIDKGGLAVINRGGYKSGERFFGQTIRWHPGCWLVVGLSYAQTLPPVESNKRTAALNSEQKKARLGVLRRHSHLMMMVRRYLSAGKTALAIRNYLRAAELAAELDDLGGAPRSWSKLDSA